MSRVLVVASDVVGARMAGPGIRAYELSRALAARHEVTLAAPLPLPSPPDRIRVVEARRGVLAREVATQDVIVVQGSAFDLLPLGQGGAPVVIDLYDPFPIEGLQIHNSADLAERLARNAADVALLRRQAAAGDHFICASQRQRLYWLGALTALGRVNPPTFDADRDLGTLLSLVPFGVPDEELPEAEGDGRTIIWGGGIWNWFDPLTLLRALADLRSDLPEVRLIFLGTSHPNPAVPSMRMLAAARELAAGLSLSSETVEFVEGWTPYAERGRALAAAAVGVSLHLPGVEADLAFRTRVLDYIWAGLPVLVTEGDEIAELVVRHGLGLVVASQDVDSVRQALLRLLTDAELARRCRLASQALRADLAWSRVAAPLSAFCDDPRRAPDRGLGSSLVGGPPWRAWRSFRREGPVAFSRRAYRHLRRRL